MGMTPPTLPPKKFESWGKKVIIVGEVPISKRWCVLIHEGKGWPCLKAQFFPRDGSKGGYSIKM